jgi:FkbM family methyltransferase
MNIHCLLNPMFHMVKRGVSTHVPNSLYTALVNMLVPNITIKRAREGYVVTRDGISLLSPTPKFLKFGKTHFTQKFERFFNIRHRDVAVDVGACIGDTTIPMALLAEHVIAVEPHPVNLKYLKFNMGGCAEIIGKAAWCRKEKIPLHVHVAPTGHSIVPHPSRKKTVLVEADRLDNMVDHADFIKVDVQGSEVEVLQGAERLLESAGRIVVETHDRTDRELRTYPAVINVLKGHGYNVAFCMDNGCVYGEK